MDKIKSKRGRKPKNKINNIPLINNKIDDTIPIITHLPIQLNQTEHICKKKIIKIIKIYKNLVKKYLKLN